MKHVEFLFLCLPKFVTGIILKIITIKFNFLPFIALSLKTEAPDVMTSSAEYRKRFPGKTGLLLIKAQNDALKKLLASWPNASILDVGGGHGMYAKDLISMGHKLSVLGSCQEAMGQVKPLVDEGKCSFTTGNFLQMPFPDKHFDVVISFRLLCHTNEWPALIKEMTRVARQGVIVDFPVRRSVNFFSEGFFNLKKNLEGPTTRPFIVFREPDVITAFSRNGFKQTGRATQLVLPAALHRILNCAPISAFMEKILRVTGITWLFGSPVVARFEPENGAAA